MKISGKSVVKNLYEFSPGDPLFTWWESDFKDRKIPNPIPRKTILEILQGDNSGYILDTDPNTSTPFVVTHLKNKSNNPTYFYVSVYWLGVLYNIYFPGTLEEADECYSTINIMIDYDTTFIIRYRINLMNNSIYKQAREFLKDGY